MRQITFRMSDALNQRLTNYRARRATQQDNPEEGFSTQAALSELVSMALDDAGFPHVRIGPDGSYLLTPEMLDETSDSQKEGEG